MAIKVTCGCGKQLAANASLAGKRGKCPYCGAGVSIPIFKASPAAPASEGLSAAVQPARLHRKPGRIAAEEEIIIDFQPERLAPLASSLVVVGGTAAAALLVGLVAGVCGTLVWQSWSGASTVATASNVASAGHERTVSENRGAPESDSPKTDPAAAAPAPAASGASSERDAAQPNATAVEPSVERAKDNPAKPAEEVPLGKTEDQLAQLDAKGMRLEQENFAQAIRKMYTSIKGRTPDRLPLIQPSNFALDSDAAAKTVGKIGVEWFNDWPTRSEDTDQVELKTVLDDKLVPSLQYFVATINGVAVRAFIGNPNADVNYVRSTLGQPTAEAQIRNDTFLMYGRLKIVVDASEKVSVIIF